MLDGTISNSLSLDGLEALTDAARVIAMQRLTVSVTLDNAMIDHALRPVRSRRERNGLARRAHRIIGAEFHQVNHGRSHCPAIDPGL